MLEIGKLGGLLVDTVGGELKQLTLESLHPDWYNPRFPPGAENNFQSDLDVYAYLDKQFDAASVAESISRHGFFLSEPLIAIPDPTLGSHYIVVEGNRRLAALRGLADPSVRAVMTDPRWKQMKTGAEAPLAVPVLVAPTREHVAPILGYRHVTGIAPWDPYQQARYVASLIDGDPGLSAVEVGELIGRDLSEVRSFYRNYSIVEQANEIFLLPDTERIIDEFGVWTRAMSSAPLREYIGALPPREVQEQTYPLPEGAQPRLSNLVTWIFGDPRSEAREGSRKVRSSRVISDSRQLTRLGRVVGSSAGLEALEAGASLVEAERALLDGSVKFAESINKAASNLEAAIPHSSQALRELHSEELGRIDIALRAIGAKE